MALTIGDLGKATGTKVETIRYYERVGLLPKPARSAANYRSYSNAQMNRLSFIRRARDLGFPLEQVRTLLSIADDRSSDCSGIDRVARDHLAAVEQKLADLSALRQELKSVINSCKGGGSVSDCRIIEALAPVMT